uniref:Uncharacterized protein n=1 Tax=Anguilla anguilla TaxID=7936 RepID=A0A0E9QRV8_ANGAN
MSIHSQSELKRMQTYTKHGSISLSAFSMINVQGSYSKLWIFLSVCENVPLVVNKVALYRPF